MAEQSKLRGELAKKFLEALRQEQLPWKACWQQQIPENAVTGKPYRGVNAMILSYMADELGYTDPRWCTYLQAKEKGWQVRKGSVSCKVEFWTYYDKQQKKAISWEEANQRLWKDPAEISNLRIVCRTYSVFNAAQIDGIPDQVQRHTDIGVLRDQRDALLRNMAVGYREEGSSAYYSLANDCVTLPPEASFDNTYSYMATFLHECGHATGHESRLNRDLSGGFGSESYAREELRAEIASAFTAQKIGMRLSQEALDGQMLRHIAYVQNWIQVLEKSPEELFRAIKDAEDISDYLIAMGEFQIQDMQEMPEAPFMAMSM